MDPIGQSPAAFTPSEGVNAGQSPTQQPPTYPAPVAPVSPSPISTPVAPLAPLATPNSVDTSTFIQQVAQYETRVRDLQSSRDRIAEEANRAKSELDALKARHTEMMSGAADAARQALEKASQLEQQLQQERARSLKAEALAAHPELAPYAELISATVDQNALNAQIAALTAARERDLAAQQAAHTPTSPANSRTIIPPANPARPNPSGQPGPSTQQMETDLRAAMEQALRSNDYSIFDRAVAAQIQASGLTPGS